MRQAGALIDKETALAVILFDILDTSNGLGGHVQGDPRVSTESIVDGYFSL
jgi:hypothetical protein